MKMTATIITYEQLDVAIRYAEKKRSTMRKTLKYLKSLRGAKELAPVKEWKSRKERKQELLSRQTNLNF